MAIVRVWLTPWEWHCCGDPFGVGDAVALNVDRAADRAWFRAQLGDAFARGIDAVESHHEQPGPERLEGRVIAIHGAIGRERARRVRREPRPPRPPMVLGESTDGSVVSAGGSPSGWYAVSSPPDPFVLVSEPIPAEGRLRPLDRVPSERRGEPAEPTEGERDVLLGYVVDVEA
jgi:hypothetical protein